MSIMVCDGCGLVRDTDWDVESLFEVDGGIWCEWCLADDLPCGCSGSDQTGCTIGNCTEDN